MNARDTEFKRIADMPANQLVSEEDVKNKVILPLLRSLGYDDGDFNYERRTGRGYVDVVVDRYPVGIVIETKAPRTRLDDYVDQLEYYVFAKHGHDRAATLAVLTDGEWFRIYAVTDALRRGTLAKYQVIEPFTRDKLTTLTLAAALQELMARESNESGAALTAIPRYRLEVDEKQAQIRAVEQELVNLRAERQRIDDRIRECESQLASQSSIPVRDLGQSVAEQGSGTDDKRPASPHILRLLREKGAYSRQTAVERKWLDRQLIRKVEGVNTKQSVSWSLIVLKDAGELDYEKRGNAPISVVWLVNR